MATTKFPVPPIPSARDLDNIANSMKQIMSIPTMGINQIIDTVNNINKSFLTQVHNLMSNAPAIPLPTPQPQQLAEKIVPTAQPSAVMTAQNVKPAKEEGPLTV